MSTRRLIVFGVAAVLCLVLGLALAARIPAGSREDPQAASPVCDRVPVAALGALLGGEVGLHSHERAGDVESCVFVHPPAQRSTLLLGTIVEINAQPGRGGYLPDAAPQAFRAVPGIGDAAHYHGIWGLIFRKGDVVVHLDARRTPFSLDSPQPALTFHESVARLISDEL